MSDQLPSIIYYARPSTLVVTCTQLSLVKYILHVKSNRNGSFESITLVITLEPFVHMCIDFELEVVGFINIFFIFLLRRGHSVTFYLTGIILRDTRTIHTHCSDKSEK